MQGGRVWGGKGLVLGVASSGCAEKQQAVRREHLQGGSPWEGMSCEDGGRSVALASGEGVLLVE